MKKNTQNRRNVRVLLQNKSPKKKRFSLLRKAKRLKNTSMRQESTRQEEKNSTQIILYEVPAMDIAQQALENLDLLVKQNQRTYTRSKVLLEKARKIASYPFKV